MDSGSSRSLTDPRFRSALALMVKKRVPESDVEDIVQSALAEAVASPSAPKDDPEALRRWIWGVARHKVVDFHRRARREEMGGDVPEVSVEGAPHSDRDLLRWAAEELPPGQDAERTLEWMLREGEGEKLESIAESEALPAPRVRQRVTRLRRHLRTRWAAEIAALAALGVLVLLAIWLVRREKPRPDIVRPETPVPMQSSELRPVPPPVLPADGDHSFDTPNDVAPLTPTPTSPIPSSSASPIPRPTGTPTAVTPAPPSTTPVTKMEPPTGKKAPGPSKPTAPKSKPAGTSDFDSMGSGTK